MPRGRRTRAGTSMVSLARLLEKSKRRINDLRDELARESRLVVGFLSQMQDQMRSLTGHEEPAHRNGSPRRGRPASGNARGGGGRGGRRGSGQREAIVAFVKAKGQPQNAEAIAKHLGKTGKMNAVRQTLMVMCKTGALASYKQDDGKYRAPKKGERGGYYGLP